jgi:hypothetical protein
MRQKAGANCIYTCAKPQHAARGLANTVLHGAGTLCRPCNSQNVKQLKIVAHNWDACHIAFLKTTSHVIPQTKGWQTSAPLSTTHCTITLAAQPAQSNY